MSSKLFVNRIVARVAARNNQHSVLVRANYSCALIRFLGASCPASLQPGNNCVNSLILFPEPGKDAIVALAVWNREKMPDDWTHAYFLDITWKNDGFIPWLDLDEAWIPSGDKPAQASECGITVQIGDVTYSSCPTDAKRQSATLRFVPDGNLLCRFLASDATAEQVAAAAQAFKEDEAWPAKYAALQQKFAEANGQIAKLKSEVNEKSHALNIANKESARRISNLQEVVKQIANTAQSTKFGERAENLAFIARLCDVNSSAER